MNSASNIGVLSQPEIKSAVFNFPDAPYRGLEPFRYVDNPIFFARTKETQRLLRFVTMYRAVLFYGDSGAGKSSLINAGLIPELVEEGFTPERIRLQPEKDNELIIARISQTASGNAPYLASNFAQDTASPETAPARIILPVRDLKKRLQTLPPNQLPLLIFDQFEEIVTLFEEARVGTNLEESLKLQKAILDVLVDLISDQTFPVKLLFVFREDYLAKLTKFFVRCPDITDQFLRLTSPEIDTLNAIICNPFMKFPGKFGNEFSEQLITNLRNQLEERSEANTLNLSEVQVACLKLWQSDSPETLLEKRRVEGLLEDFLSESLNTLPKDLHEVSIALLRKMVTSSGTRNVISEDDLIISVRKEGFSEDKIKKSLDALVYQTKLVRRERRHDTFFYQIVSEFLVPWIRRQQQEQKARMARYKLFRTAAIIVGVALIITIGTAGWAYYIDKFRTEEVKKIEAVQTAEKAAEEATTRADEAIKAKEAAEQEAAKAGELKTVAESRVEEFAKQLESQIKQIGDLNQQLARIKQDNSKLHQENTELKLNTESRSAAELEREVSYWKDKYNTYNNSALKVMQEKQNRIIDLEKEIATKNEKLRKCSPK